MLNIDIGRYSSILKEIERNEASIFLIKKMDNPSIQT